jgi:hypothetical protein
MHITHVQQKIDFSLLMTCPHHTDQNLSKMSQYCWASCVNLKYRGSYSSNTWSGHEDDFGLTVFMRQIVNLNSTLIGHLIFIYLFLLNSHRNFSFKRKMYKIQISYLMLQLFSNFKDHQELQMRTHKWRKFFMYSKNYIKITHIAMSWVKVSNLKIVVLLI